MSRSVPLPLALLVCVFLVGTASVMAWESLALAGDGSFYLVRILGHDEFFGPNTRLFANLVREAPVLLLSRVGLTDTHALSAVLGLGQLVLPALVWSAAVLLVRAERLEFAAVAMTAGLCAASTWFFNVSESVLAVPLTVLVGTLLWRPATWRWRHAVLATAASAVLVASYEAAIATGAVLAAWAAWRGVESRTDPDRYGSLAVAVTSGLSVVVAAAGGVRGTGPSGTRSSLYFVLSGEPWSFYVGLGAIVLTTLAVGWTGGPRGRWSLFGAGSICAAIALLGMEPTTVAAFQARGGASLVGLGLVLFLWWRWIPRRAAHAARSRSRSDRGPSTLDWPLLVPVAFVGASMAVSLHGLSSWARSLDVFRAEVNRVSGIASVAEVLPTGRRQVVWDWTSPSLSLVVRGEPGAGVLVDTSPSFVPFPPAAASRELPEAYTWGR